MILVIVLLCISLVVTIDGGEVPTSQINGLYYLYNRTAGIDWTWTNSSTSIPWDFNMIFDNNTNPCMDNWQGINCTENCVSSSSTPCYITAISLYDNHMVGTIPSEISLISTLEYLSLTYNSLMGTLPTAVGELTSI